MSKREILRATSFGKRIAEEEGDELESYFVETDQWQRIFAGDVDVVYGSKGAGKSAIYSLLLRRTDELFDRGILITAAEDPRGTPVFKDLVADPPASETEFRNLWKIYFLSLIGSLLREYGVTNASSAQVISTLEEAQLLPREKSLRSLLRSVVDYVRGFLKAESYEGGLQIDPVTGIPSGVTGKITLREPSASQKSFGLISVDSLLDLANNALTEARFSIWLILDRLDVAFADTEELEGNALRSLFRVYLDLLAHKKLSLKIFLRSDIWKRITNEGFREASHVTRNITISWGRDALLNLVIRRVLRNDSVRGLYGVDEVSIISDVKLQEELFYRVFPKQVNVGPNKPTAFDWLMSRTRDSTGETAPRELIHLLSSTRDVQLRKLEVGGAEPPEEQLFERIAMREALPEVSRVRLEQTLYAEHPDLRQWLQKLEGQKTQQSLDTLTNLWRVERETASNIANQLVEVGFFERRGARDDPAFWVPFLYREALNMVQGSAIPGQDDGEQLELDL